MMRRLAVSLSLLPVILSGCGKDSTELPVDGRDFDGVAYSEPAPYTGRVIDGYLENARVWLDMDGDGQYTAGPLSLELSNGNTAVLDSGEPTAMTGAGGRFSLDISELALPAEIGPDLDPGDYPLYAVALPGKTLEQTPGGPVAVEHAYLLSAPPGVRNVTPLTMLARYRTLAGLGSFLEVPDNLSSSLDNINLLRDYVLAGDERAHAYARALARFAASQVPTEYNSVLAQAGSDGTERYLSSQAVFMLGISLVQNAPDVIAVVDQAASGDYASVDVDSLVLPDVPLELSNPKLLTSQRIYAQSESGGLPTNQSNLRVSAELHFDYAEDGRLIGVSSDGCMNPSMPELARLIGVNGYMSSLDAQWLPSVSLSEQSRVVYESPGIDERLIFDWDNARIYFETATTCHEAEGISAGSSELSGSPEVTYRWTRSSGALSELIAEIPQSGGSTVTRTLVPQPVPVLSEPPHFQGYTLSDNGSDVSSLLFSGSVTQCAPQSDEIAAMNQVATAEYAYAFTGYEPQPSGFTGLTANYDTRQPATALGDNPVNRLLRYGFLDPAMSDLSNVDNTSGFEWVMYYPSVLDPDNPNLVEEAYLKAYGGPRACGLGYDEPPYGAYAWVQYSYQTLSDYLVGLLN